MSKELNNRCSVIIFGKVMVGFAVNFFVDLLFRWLVSKFCARYDNFLLFLVQNYPIIKTIIAGKMNLFLIKT